MIFRVSNARSELKGESGVKCSLNPVKPTGTIPIDRAAIDSLSKVSRVF